MYASHSNSSSTGTRSLTPDLLEDRSLRVDDGDALGRSCLLGLCPRCWSSLPPAIRLAVSIGSFESNHTAFLFAEDYAAKTNQSKPVLLICQALVDDMHIWLK